MYLCVSVRNSAGVCQPLLQKASASPISKLELQEGFLGAKGFVKAEPRRSSRLKFTSALPLVAEDSDLDHSGNPSKGSKELQEDSDFKVGDVPLTSDNSLQSVPQQIASRQKVSFGNFSLEFEVHLSSYFQVMFREVVTK